MILRCPECPTELVVDPSVWGRLVHHSDGSHRYAPVPRLPDPARWPPVKPRTSPFVLVASFLVGAALAGLVLAIGLVILEGRP